MEVYTHVRYSAPSDVTAVLEGPEAWVTRSVRLSGTCSRECEVADGRTAHTADG